MDIKPKELPLDMEDLFEIPNSIEAYLYTQTEDNRRVNGVLDHHDGPNIEEFQYFKVSMPNDYCYDD